MRVSSLERSLQDNVSSADKEELEALIKKVESAVEEKSESLREDIKALQEASWKLSRQAYSQVRSSAELLRFCDEQSTSDEKAKRTEDVAFVDVAGKLGGGIWKHRRLKQLHRRERKETVMGLDSVAPDARRVKLKCIDTSCRWRWEVRDFLCVLDAGRSRGAPRSFPPLLFRS